MDFNYVLSLTSQTILSLDSETFNELNFVLKPATLFKAKEDTNLGPIYTYKLGFDTILDFNTFIKTLNSEIFPMSEVTFIGDVTDNIVLKYSLIKVPIEFTLVLNSVFEGTFTYNIKEKRWISSKENNQTKYISSKLDQWYEFLRT